MIYKKIETHETGKLKICPVCKNEITNLEGNYCQICGCILKNECLNSLCKNFECNPLPSNARYCPNCGEESSFFKKQILPPWQTKFERYEINKDTSLINSNQIQFIEQKMKELQCLVVNDCPINSESKNALYWIESAFKDIKKAKKEKDSETILNKKTERIEKKVKEIERLITEFYALSFDSDNAMSKIRKAYSCAEISQKGKQD